MSRHCRLHPTNPLKILSCIGAIPGIIALSPVVQARPDEAQPAWKIHVGPARLQFDDGVRLSALGNEVPQTSVHTAPDYALAVEIDRRIVEGLFLGVTLGVPPRTNVLGRGSLASFGSLGKARYGPASLTLFYQVRVGPIMPYIGAGLAVIHIFSTDDGAISNLRVDDAAGPVVQAGADVMLRQRLSLFADFKKASLHNNFRGDIGLIPIEGRLKTDPMVLQIGMGIFF